MYEKRSYWHPYARNKTDKVLLSRPKDLNHRCEEYGNPVFQLHEKSTKHLCMVQVHVHLYYFKSFQT